MYRASDAFVKSIYSQDISIRAYLKFGSDFIRDTTNLVELLLEDNSYDDDQDVDTFIGTFISRSGSFKLRGYTKDLTDQDIEVFIGVTLNDGSVEYVPFGEFKCYDVENSKTNFETTAKIADKRILFNEECDMSIFTWPTTRREFVQKICDVVGVKLCSTSFPLEDEIIKSELGLGLESKYADGIKAVAQACGCFAKINRNNELEIRSFVDTDLKVSKNDYFEYSHSKFYGPVNSLVLSNMPQNSNVYLKDEESIEKYGLNELQIVNNPLFLRDREEYIVSIFEKLNGLSYTEIEYRGKGDPRIDSGDLVTFIDMEGNEIKTVVLNHSLKFTGGLISTISTPALSKTQINYKKATSLEKRILNTELEVDKVSNRITAEITEVNTKIENIKIPYIDVSPPENPQKNQHWVNISIAPPEESVWNGNQWISLGEYKGDLEGLLGRVEELNTSLVMQQGQVDVLIENNTTEIDGEKVTIKSITEQLLLTVDGLENKITTTGGNNLISNSFGAFGDVWEGTYATDSSINVKNKNIYGVALLLMNDTITQTVTLPQGKYTLSFGYWKHIPLASTKLIINDIEFQLTNTEYTNFTYSFELTTRIFTIQFVSDTDKSCTICNLMLNQGEDAMVWELAAGETKSDIVEFSHSGFTLSSPNSDVVFNAKNDIIGFKNKNTNEYVSTFTDVGIEVNEIVVKNRAKIVCVLFEEEIINGESQIGISKMGGSR